MIFSTFALSLCTLAVVNAQANNDWSVPCHGGTCSYDLPASSGSGTISISGSATAISDVTHASGWTIMECDPDALEQTIRLVCHDEAAGCDHIDAGAGAVGTLVRLPESCGGGPFARVSGMGIATNQSVPDEVVARFARRDVAPQVKWMALDTNYSNIDTAISSPINFTFIATNLPATVDSTTKGKRALSFGAGGLSLGKATPIAKASDATATGNIVKVDPKTHVLPPMSFNKQINLLDVKQNCGPVKGEAKADIAGTGTATISFTVKAAGTLFPPHFSSFELKTGLDAEMSGILTLNTNVAVSGGSGTITVWEQGVPGLSIPGVITVGPSLKVEASVVATTEVAANMKINLGYHVKGAKASFPPTAETNNFLAAPASKMMSFAASPTVSGKVTVDAHLIPSVRFGISALNGHASVQAFISMDASASLTGTMSATVAASAGGPPVPPKDAPPVPPKDAKYAAKPAAKGKRSYLGVRSAPSYDIAVTRGAELESRDIEESTLAARASSGSIKGCVEVGAGLDFNLGVEGSLFNIINKGTKKNLFSKKFSLYNKCLGGAVAKRSEQIYGRRSTPRRSLEARGNSLTCLATTVSGALSSFV